MLNTYKAAELVIAEDDTRSDVLEDENLRFVKRVVVEAPDTLSGTVTVQVREEGASDWDDLERVDGEVVELTAGQVSQFHFPGSFELSLLSDGAEGSNRTFSIYGVEDLR